MCCRTVLTVLVWKPEVVCEEVGHVVVQPLQHVQGIIDEEDGVIITIQHPLEVVTPSKVSSQKGCHSSPVQSIEQVSRSTDSRRAVPIACNTVCVQEWQEKDRLMPAIKFG